MTAARIAPPFEDQCFTSHQQWVNKASSWLTNHPQYKNTEHGETKGWRGNHFTALCFDSLGRRVRNGGDFQKAHDEGAFPVWWIWPDQICEIVVERAEALASKPVPDLSAITVATITGDMTDDLRVLLGEANAKYEAMTPEDRDRMWVANRESFVRGMTTPCEHGKLDFEQCVECRKGGGA